MPQGNALFAFQTRNNMPNPWHESWGEGRLQRESQKPLPELLSELAVGAKSELNSGARHERG
jgi:hypothetical protein